MFHTRSLEPERIDTGDYTPEEYDRFLKEIAFINRFIGDSRALRKTLLAEIERLDLREFSILDVGAGSGELLRQIAKFADRSGRKTCLAGIELSAAALQEMQIRSAAFPNILPVRGDAFSLPFADKTFDYAICSLFTHHLTDEGVVSVLKEFKRVSRRGFFVIDLTRERNAYLAYKLFCMVFRISPLVRHDGSLSILKGFKASELEQFAYEAGVTNIRVEKVFPARLVLSGE